MSRRTEHPCMRSCRSLVAADLVPFMMVTLSSPPADRSAYTARRSTSWSAATPIAEEAPRHREQYDVDVAVVNSTTDETRWLETAKVFGTGNRTRTANRGGVAPLLGANSKRKVERDLNRLALDAYWPLTDIIVPHARGCRMSRGCHALCDMRSRERRGQALLRRVRRRVAARRSRADYLR